MCIEYYDTTYNGIFYGYAHDKLSHMLVLFEAISLPIETMAMERVAAYMRRV